MRLYIIRHGDPDYEKDCLTPDGKKEAEALAKRMQNVEPSRLYTSPLGRARETASYTEKALGLKAEVLQWAREWNFLTIPESPLGRVAIWDVPGEIYQRVVSGTYDSSEYDGFVPETADVKYAFESLSVQADEFFSSFGYTRKEGSLYRIDSHSDEQIALFCHNGFGLALISHLLSIPYQQVWCSLWLATTSVTTILFEERTENFAVPRALTVGDTSHLYEAGLPILPRGVKANYF
ncbi:MAG: histidine phosphatase family protein [Spirochaetes bacterium]|jgi:broad specificity phosphatase PhoE|nr:histidine phosphatase family protein [Spirochaetota bacterium]